MALEIHYASSSLGGASAITINDDVVEAHITTPLLNTAGRVALIMHTSMVHHQTRLCCGWCNLYYSRHTHFRCRF